MNISPELLDTLARDFKAAFEEDENKDSFSPSDFWSRWHKQGHYLPEVLDIVQIISFVRYVGHHAANMEDENEKN